jgi:hypothetical protein
MNNNNLLIKDLRLLANLRVFMSQHKGMENAVSNDELASSLGVSKVKARGIYAQAVRMGSLYGSHPDKGFFEITSREELDISTRQLKSRMKKMSERLNALERAYEMSQVQPIKMPLKPGQMCLTIPIYR